MRVRADAWSWCIGLCVTIGLAVGGRRRRCWECFWEAEVEVDRLGDYEKQREARRHSEGVLVHDAQSGKICAQRGAECKGDAEAHAHKRHGRAALTLVADVGRDRHSKLDVALAQPSDDAAREERAEVGGCDPERNAEHVARHRPQQCCPPAIFVRERANHWRSDSLAQREEGAECSAEQHNVVARDDGLRERVLVCIQSCEDLRENRVRIAGLMVAVELDELGKERENECEGYLELPLASNNW